VRRIMMNRDQTAEVIHMRLMSEPQYQAVLKMVEKYLPKFDVMNMIVAMHQCAVTAKDHSHLKKQIQRDPAFVKLFHTAKETVLSDVSTLDPQINCDLLWSCARLDIFDSELFSSVVADATQRLEKFKPLDISLLCFALGCVDQKPRMVFMQALVRELRDRVRYEFTQQELSMIVYGMMKLGIRDDRLMGIITEDLKRKGMDGIPSLTVVCLAYAYSKLQYWDEEIFATFGQSIMENLGNLEEGEISMSLLAYAYGTSFLQESSFIMEAMLKGLELRLDQMSNRTLTTLAFAVGKFRYLLQANDPGTTGRMRSQYDTEDSTAVMILDQVGRRSIQAFTMTELSLITYSAMRLKCRNQDFLKDASMQFIKNAAELNEVEIVNMAYAFARLDYIDLNFWSAMVEEIKRRNLLEEMDTLSMSVLLYSLGVSHVQVEELMEQAASIVCRRAGDFSAQELTMIMWASAVLKCGSNTEAMVSSVLENILTRIKEFNQLHIATILWASALLSGTASGLWLLKIIFLPGFNTLDWSESQYTMLYHTLTSLRAEEGLEMQELGIWQVCLTQYEENTALYGRQNIRLADRLRMQGVTHRANAFPPSLDGFNPPGVRADVVIEKLRLIIEVEGPRRMTMPLEQILAEFGDTGGDGKDDGQGPVLCGTRDEVLGEARESVEGNLTGSAMFKRRLLRKCGWRVVTVSFDENEEYIADALTNMAEASQGGSSEPEEEEEEKAEGQEPAEGEEAPDLDTPAADEVGDVMEEIGGSGGALSAEGQEDEGSMSEYERKLRREHARAFVELKRRLITERGNAASTDAFSSHLEYKKWQLGIEKEVFKEMVAAL